MKLYEHELIAPVIALGFVGIAVILGFFLIIQSFQNYMKDIELNNEIRGYFNSLDCSRQKMYLDDKSIISSTLFDYNIYDELNKNYSLRCNDMNNNKMEILN